MNELRELLIEDEGYRLVAYDDKTGRPPMPGVTLKGIVTIGVGRNLILKGLTSDEVDYLLQNDINECCWQAAEIFPNMDFTWNTIEPREAVIVSMIFNLGKAGFERFTKTIRAIQAGKWELAATEMLDSRWANQVGRRATKLSTMMKRGTWPTPT